MEWEKKGEAPMWEGEERGRQGYLWTLLFLLFMVLACLCEILSRLAITGEAPVETGKDCFSGAWRETGGRVSAEEVDEYLSARPLMMVTGIRDDWLLLVNYGATETEGICVEPALVRVGTPAQTGSGLILEIARDSVIVSTCAHVMGQEREARVSFFDGEEVSARLLTEASGFDIAFLEIPVEEIPPSTRFALRRARMDVRVWEEMEEGEGVFILASVNVPAGDYYEGYAQYKEIYVPEFGCSMLCCKCEPVLGMSGGGVFDRAGNLLGMVNGGTQFGQVVGLTLPVMLGQFAAAVGGGG